MAREYLRNKKIFLTGASSGIGSEMAVQMARKGAVLGLLARRESELEKVAEAVIAEGGEARVFPGDVTDMQNVKAAVDAFKDEFGKVDILIANAGVGGNNKETREIQNDAVARVININLIGAVNSVSAVLPQMLEQGSGHLVAISSLAGFRGLPKSAAYSGSKAGMSAFFESLRVDFAPKGIDVSIIAPGFIKTPLTSGRSKKLPFVLELEDGAARIVKAIEKKKAFYAFPWQLATLVRLAAFLPPSIYDKFANRNSYRE
ncbi:MAG: SDR family NAD(P)-dependent oxidoreductase [Acidobacteria bacterium]|nr:MAG: SDR family NAD(P)-dependent oxidoreductase [Acidobacteriota bacterium]REK01384.1 MAG: SDR family NAD(P)-dependent oxidoreductase [Acidobacteriota bacterium]REK14340.1 MAG: SDR family NAD(P)-dependent oxidoreductase [Acidobacteriota bacterium]REK45055.1 MAG: SDR family NAD(P)-dependent oxidoreductase [Acidobacteriota bacterium]